MVFLKNQKHAAWPRLGSIFIQGPNQIKSLEQLKIYTLSHSLRPFRHLLTRNLINGISKQRQIRTHLRDLEGTVINPNVSGLISRSLLPFNDSIKYK